MSWVHGGIVWWGGMCEDCGWQDFQERQTRRLQAIGDPREVGLATREREDRADALAALSRDRGRYIEDHRKREERYRWMATAKPVGPPPPEDWMAKQELAEDLRQEEFERRRVEQLRELENSGLLRGLGVVSGEPSPVDPVSIDAAPLDGGAR